MKNPCHGCTRRTITCHGVCRQYDEWKKFNEDRREWLKGHKYEPSEGLRKGSIRSIRERARGYKKRKVKNYD